MYELYCLTTLLYIFHLRMLKKKKKTSDYLLNIKFIVHYI